MTSSALLDLEPWRKLMQAMADEGGRWQIFSSAVAQFAGLVGGEVQRVDAIDRLQSLAEAYELDVDHAQLLIADAFRTVADAPVKPNGKKPSTIQSKQNFIRAFEPPDYLIMGMLQRRFIYSLTGQTGHAKTAVALLIAQLVASEGASFLGNKKVEKGRVIYFVGENPDDVRMRVIGSDWQRRRRGENPERDNLWFAPGRELTMAEIKTMLDDDAAANGPPALIVIDTSAAYFLGQDENSNPQLGEHARSMRLLTTLAGGPCVIVLCHPAKRVADPGELLPRGGGAFLAEMDGNLSLWRTSDLSVELDYTKMRGPGFQPLQFEVRPIAQCADLKDSAGRFVPTVEAVFITERQANDSANAEVADADLVLRRKLAGVDNESMVETAEALDWRVGQYNDPDRKRVQRALKALEKDRFVKNELGKYVLTDRGKERARAVGLRALREAHADEQSNLNFR
jgi:AAA domain